MFNSLSDPRNNEGVRGVAGGVRVCRELGSWHQSPATVGPDGTVLGPRPLASPSCMSFNIRYANSSPMIYGGPLVVGMDDAPVEVSFKDKESLDKLRILPDQI